MKYLVAFFFLFSTAALAVPADWVLVHKDKTGNYYTSPVCSTHECSVREASDVAFLGSDLDGDDDADDS